MSDVVTLTKSEAARQLTKNGDRFRNPMSWSPDGKMLTFSDKSHQLWIVDATSGRQTLVDKAPTLRGQEWSPDSKWLAYVKGEQSELKDIWIYNLKSKKKIQLTSVMTDEHGVSWDP